jgi:hypothetical protein
VKDTNPFGSDHVSHLLPLSEDERAANYEASHLAYNRAAGSDDPSVSRSAVLHCMGAWSDGIMAKREVLALLEQHEANLRRTWEHIELGHARKRAEDAMRGACRAIMEGKLL